MNDGELFFSMTFRPLPPEPIDNGLWMIQDCLLLNVFAVTLNTWGINFNHSVNLIFAQTLPNHLRIQTLERQTGLLLLICSGHCMNLVSRFQNYPKINPSKITEFQQKMFIVSVPV